MKVYLPHLDVPLDGVWGRTAVCPSRLAIGVLNELKWETGGGVQSE